MTLQTPEPQVRRAANGRPYIKGPDGKEVTYTRTTTFVGAFEDTYMLEQWKMRQAAIGLSLRPDLQLAVHAHQGDKSRMNDICREALDAAAASAGATTGTALHSLTEQLDRGLGLPANLPPETVADLHAYHEATAELEPVLIERMTVHDGWKVAGTPDRVVRYQGQFYIADLKTGGIDFGAGKIAAQLAMYARGEVYDIATGQRSPHNASLDRGIVIHLPAGTGVCDVQWVDLRAGWEIAQVCKQVRDVRSLNAGQLYTAIGGKNDKALAQILAGQSAPPPPVARLSWGVDEIGAAIVTATTREELTALWHQHQSAWTDVLTQLARERTAELVAAST